MVNNVILPTRDFLRQLIAQSYVKESELKNILRNRGVFISSEDKKLFANIIIKTGLSAEEYIQLKESYRSKEDNPKFQTRQIKWSSKETTLYDALCKELDFRKLLDDNFGTVKLNSEPSFHLPDPQNKNLIRLNIDLKRKDITKNWGENTTYHNGYIELAKKENSSEVQLNLCHSSKEVKEFGNKITNALIKKFKDDKYISENDEIVSIRFHDFDNNGRVKFLKELSNIWKINELYFKDTKDLQFSPDNFDEKTPVNLQWMKDTIEDMKLKGKGIHSTFFVKNREYHKYMKLYRISCDYTFAFTAFEGNCRINFEFHDFESQNSELVVDITNLNLSKNENNIPKNSVKLQLLKILDTKKMEFYEKNKIRTTPSNL